jgi:hypothetical protein
LIGSSKLSATAKEFLRKSVTSGTIKGYERSHLKWEKFLDENHAKGEEERDAISASVIIEFMASLHAEGLRGDQITSILTGVKQTRLMQGKDVDVFLHPQVLQARNSGRYSTKELREGRESKLLTKKLPWTIDQVKKARVLLWAGNTWEQRAVYLGIALAFDTGRRIGNFTHPSSKGQENHCIRTKDVWFVVDTEGTTIAGGSQFYELGRSAAFEANQVSAAHLNFLSQKEKAKGSLQVEEQVVLARGSCLQSQLLDDLIEWCLFNQNQEEEELLTRSINGRKKVLLSRKVSEGIRLVAESFGLDPSRFSAISLRSGYASATVNGGLPREALNRAGWAKGSNTPYKHYVRNLQNNGATTYSAEEFNVTHVRKMNPKGGVAVRDWGTDTPPTSSSAKN